jgi:hypothetical protein
MKSRIKSRLKDDRAWRIVGPQAGGHARVRTATRYLKMEKIDMASSVCVGSRARWVLRLGVSQWENKKSPDIDVGARTCLPIQASGGKET